LSIIPLQASRAEQPAATTQPTTARAKHAADRAEARIKELHERLGITAAQETLWGAVAQTLRDNATALRAAVADWIAHRDTMTAIDDLKSYQIIAEAHSNGSKKLITAFEPLYAALTPDQQKKADHIFKEHRHRFRF
jgi:hypothetical protein